jgi:hypothetical protein
VVTAAGTVLTAGVSTAVTLAVTRASERVAEPSIPIAVNVVDDPALIDAFADSLQQMLVPAHPASMIGQPRDDMCAGALRGWALGLNGSDWKTTRFQLQLQGHSSKPVLISGLSVRIIARRQPQPSVVLECLPAGHVSPRELSINLDAVHPTARYEEKGHKQPFGFTLNSGEQEVFNITAYTYQGIILDWYPQIQLVVDGKQQTVGVQDRGKPFHTTAIPVGSEHRYAWQPDGWTEERSGTVANPFS